MTAPRIYADFNGIGPSARNPDRWAIPLDTLGSTTDLATAGIRLREGMRLVVFDWSDEEEDLEGDATVHYDALSAAWIAELDASGYRYVPAHDRTRPTAVLCVSCRTALPSHPEAEWRPVELCPNCGTPLAAPIAAPESSALERSVHV